MIRTRVSLLLVLVTGAFAAWPEEPVDWDMVSRIRDEGFHRSQVMDSLEYLTDVIGPRLTGSPQMRQANEWTRDKLAEWGLENAVLEPWGEFGRGWSFERCSVRMTAPHKIPLSALPKAWTPGTDGPVTGAMMKVDLDSEEDFEEYTGKLEGKILLMDKARSPMPATKEPFIRHSESALESMEGFRIPAERSDEWREKGIERWKLGKKIREFLIEQKALAIIEISRYDNNVVHVGGSRSYTVGENPGPPSIYLASGHFNRIIRLLDREMDVEITIDIEAQFHEEETASWNTIAEIPGASKKSEIVMLGGHLDSWHAATGATDNAAGCAVAMEAVRILKALGVRPRRTIRIALWSAEEQGLIGSREYVSKHFASRPEPEDPDQMELPRWYRTPTWPIETTREHGRFSVYFNFDNGSGKIRGVYCQENSAAVPIFEAWLKPFEDLGADTITLRTTGGTDHLPFDYVGLPGFQFIQDPLDYSSQTHHTVLDDYDHLQREDMMQASVIMASFVYHAAMRKERFPRKPMPKEDPREKEKKEEKEEKKGAEK